MVNYGPSKGCNTCRKRRVKCDEGKPECNRCLQSGFTCLGYNREKGPLQIRFKDQTQAVAQSRRKRSPGPQAGARCAAVASPVQIARCIIQDSSASNALRFFIDNFATSGRGRGSGHGFFENIVPLLSAAESESAITLAVSSVSTLLFSNWMKEPENRSQEMGPSYHYLGRALSRLNSELLHPSEATAESTLMAIILLQFYENISAVLGLQSVSRTHQDGAIALVRRLPASYFRNDTGGRLLQYLLNTEVVAALRDQRSLDFFFEELLERFPNISNINPSARLDCVAMKVANIQARFVELVADHQYCSDTHCYHVTQFARLFCDVRDLEVDMYAWKQSLGPNWHGVPWEPQVPSAFYQVPETPMYEATCEVYPTVQIASLWNSWRGYHMIVTRILAHLEAFTWPDDFGISQQPDLCEGPTTPLSFQSLVDSTLYSIPFKVGNRTKRCSFEDLNDPSLFFPTLYNIRPDYIPPYLNPHDELASEDNHRRNVVAIGGWHALKPLSQIVMYSSQWKHCCEACGALFKKEQVEWASEQLLRVMALFDLTPMSLQIAFVTSDTTEMFADRIGDALKISGL